MKIYLSHLINGERRQYLIVDEVSGADGMCFTVHSEHGELLATDVPFEEVINIYHRLMEDEFTYPRNEARCGT